MCSENSTKKVYDDEIEDKTMRGESDSEAKHNEEEKNMRSRSSQKSDSDSPRSTQTWKVH